MSLLSLSHSSVTGRPVCEPALAASTFKGSHVKDLPLLLKKNEFPLPKDRVNLSCNFFLENPKSDLPGAPGFEDGRLFLFSPLFLPLDLPTHSFHSLVSPLPEQESACFVT